LETVACNLCGSREHTFVYEMPDRFYFPDEVFRVVECNGCGLGFVNPRPTFQEIAKYYPAEYFKTHTAQSSGNCFTRRYTQEARYLDAVPDSTPPRKLLDVGCASGDFPRFMATRGWQVEGVEVSPSTQPITDFPVYTQEFDKIPISEPRFDAVTAWAVLEHVHDPMAYFRKASQILKPNGRFIFLVTNFQSAASRHLFGEDVPRHLYFFTRDTVRRYLQSSGLSLEKEDNGSAVYKMAPRNWLPYILQSKVRGKKFTFKEIPLTSREFRQVNHLQPGIRAALQYVAYSPAAAIDRLFWPLIEGVQILRKTYGISVYIGRKE
jgi:2-polyprenyl-3-methyl-5-hydroxy-6-metoxy-1,4-benzoquinol methylase